MTPQQKQRAQAAIGTWHSSNDDSLREYQSAELMAALLQELIDAPEPEPVAHAVILPNGMTRIWFSDKERGEQWRKEEGIKQELTPLYTAPPTTSVPDEQLQAAFDRGLKAGNEQAIAQQIEIHKLHDLLAVQQPEQSDDQVRDAERLRTAHRLLTMNAIGYDEWIAAVDKMTAIEREILGGGHD